MELKSHVAIICVFDHYKRSFWAGTDSSGDEPVKSRCQECMDRSSAAQRLNYILGARSDPCDSSGGCEFQRMAMKPMSRFTYVVLKLMIFQTRFLRLLSWFGRWRDSGRHVLVAACGIVTMGKTSSERTSIKCLGELVLSRLRDELCALPLMSNFGLIHITPVICGCRNELRQSCIEYKER